MKMAHCMREWCKGCEKWWEEKVSGFLCLTSLWSVRGGVSIHQDVNPSYLNIIPQYIASNIHFIRRMHTVIFTKEKNHSKLYLMRMNDGMRLPRLIGSVYLKGKDLDGMDVKWYLEEYSTTSFSLNFRVHLSWVQQLIKEKKIPMITYNTSCSKGR